MSNDIEIEIIGILVAEHASDAADEVTSNRTTVAFSDRNQKSKKAAPGHRSQQDMFPTVPSSIFGSLKDVGKYNA